MAQSERPRSRFGVIPLLSRATALLGTAPLHYWDFTANRALFNGVDVGAVTATPNWNFSRASSGYAQTLAGALVSFGSGVPRITDKGMLVEDARTNLLLQSQTLSIAPWAPFQSSVTADATAAPDGTTTADKLVEDTTPASTHFHRQSVTLTASVQTFSIYAKAAERSQTSIFVPTAAFADVTFRTASFTLTGAGTVFALGGAGATASIEALANGWYRCVLNVPATLAVAATIQYGMLVADNPTYTGDGTSGLFLWGAQVEAATTHSSYITTTAASVTRAADVLTVSSPGVAYPLTMYAELQLPTVNTTGATQLTLDDTTANNRSYLLITSGALVGVDVASGGVAQAAIAIAGAISANTTYKNAARISTNSVQMSRGATLGTEDTVVTAPATATSLRIGSRAGSFLGGYLLRAAIFNSALNDAALQRATT